MTGLATILQTTLSDTTLPIIDLVDKLLVHGSLLLVDPIHSASPWAAGVPANGAVLPNIAWRRAKAMIGSGDASSLGVYFDDAHQAADALFERTSKGGLHCIYSRVNNTNINRGAALRAQVAIRNYIYTNRAHHFYQSVWSNRTRVAITTGGALQRIAQLASEISGAHYITLFDAGNNWGNAKTGSRASAGVNSVGNQIRTVDGTNFAVAPNSAADTAVTVFQCGNYGIGGTAWANKSASEVFYRGYVEDLTVSGRTYEQVDAIDYAFWQANFVAGGRLAGDTYTDPAIFP